MQVGYAVDCIGDYGNPAHLRRDAQVLVTAVQQAVATFGKQEYLQLRQAGMMQDMSWQLPAQEWEQVSHYVFQYANSAGFVPEHCCVLTWHWAEMMLWHFGIAVCCT